MHVSHNMLDSQSVFRCTTSYVRGQGMGGICNARSRHRNHVVDASYSFRSTRGCSSFFSLNMSKSSTHRKMKHWTTLLIHNAGSLWHTSKPNSDNSTTNALCHSRAASIHTVLSSASTHDVSHHEKSAAALFTHPDATHHSRMHT